MRDVLFCCCIILFICGCTGRMGSGTVRFVRANDSAQKISRAQSLHELGDIDAALSHIKTLIDTTPYSSFHDQAYELLITWLLQMGRTAEARRYASYFLHHHGRSKHCDVIIALFDSKKSGPKAIPLFSVGTSAEENSSETTDNVNALDEEISLLFSPELETLSHN